MGSTKPARSNLLRQQLSLAFVMILLCCCARGSSPGRFGPLWGLPSDQLSCKKHFASLNHACLDITSRGVDGCLLLELQNEECEGCPLKTVWHDCGLVEKSHNTEVLVRTTSATRLRLSKSRDGSNNWTTLCSANYSFGELGVYEIGGNSNEESCKVKVTTFPLDPFKAFCSLILALMATCVLWICVKNIFQRIMTGKNQQEEKNKNIFECATTSSSSSQNSKGRIRSVDTFRGIVVSIMIFVNSGGGGLPYFHHAAWNGFSFADLVLPWFLFAMGASLVLSLKSQLDRGTSKRRLLLVATRRSVAFIALGIALNGMKRALGVLQRFGLTYIIVATAEIGLLPSDLELKRHIDDLARKSLVLESLTMNGWQLAFSAALAATHSCVTFLLPVPGCPTGYLGPGGLHGGGQYANCTGGAAGYIDRFVFGENLLPRLATLMTYEAKVPFESEGLLGTLTASVTVLAGCQAGKILLGHQNWKGRVARWMSWAVFYGVAAGILCNFSAEGGIIPVNKKLWSLSFTLALTSVGLILLLSL